MDFSPVLPGTGRRNAQKGSAPVNVLITLLYLCCCGLFIYLETPGYTTLDDILRSGEITVITRNNAHCYYLYRDQPMGFEYDLAKAFADYLGVRLKVRVASRWEGMIPALKRGVGAFIAASMTVTSNRKADIAFSNGYMDIRQHIIVNRNDPGTRSIRALAGKTVWVRKGTSYEERLKELKKQGIALRIRLMEDIPTEELIRRVAAGEIEATIADSNIAMLNRRYYPSAIMGGAISGTEHLGWAVHPGAGKLLEAINAFFRRIKKDGTFDDIYQRYYADVDSFDFVDIRTYHRRLKTRLPRYQTIIQEAARKNGFDWRLIAAQMYQESHFNPRARSHAGAYGLMQLTPSTAAAFGLKDILDPDKNIRTGVRHLKNLYDCYDSVEDPDRLFMALAAYNIGQGHIYDARRLAARMKLDVNKWSSLMKTLPLLRYRRYHKHTLYGYARGTEPIDYIRQIMIYYDILKRQGITYESEDPIV